ncbi:hypothetical protein BGX28_009581 [Mortierella sp. GBA30]|nr:hypothetical protein BGX28_009581 [Mortierella sp. GBA30]
MMSSYNTIKAAVFEGVKPSAPFVAVQRIPAPVAGNGDVVVKVLATRVVNYAKEIFNGTRPYPTALPMVPGPGGIGVIQSVGPGAAHLQAGQLVYIDSTVRARDHPVSPQVMLQGLIAVGEAQKLQEIWRNGSWAEETLVPFENVTVIPPSVQQKFSPETLTALANYTVPYGGLIAADLRPGQTIAITGSTGPFGSAAVAVALSMGARRVLASGRNKGQLEEFVALYGPRVVPVVATGDEDKDTEAFIKAAGEGFEIDVAFDILPPSAPFSTARAAINALRVGGVAVLMGGVQASVELPYQLMMMKNITVKGNFMYPRSAPTTLLGLVEAGLLDLSVVKPRVFKLDEIDSAIEWSSLHASAFEATVVAP